MMPAGGKNTTVSFASTFVFSVLAVISAAITPWSDAFPAPPPVIVSSGIPLAWAEEFDASGIDTNVWSFQRSFFPSGYDISYSRSDRYLSIGSGTADLEVLRNYYEGKHYESCCISTVHHRWFGISGRGAVFIEASIKSPRAAGVTPFFWTLDTNQQFLWWPPRGGVVIFGQDGDTIFGRACPASDSVVSVYKYATPRGYDTAYHRYGLYWDSLFLGWYVDDTLRGRYDIAGTTPEFRRSQSLFLNVAIDKNESDAGLVDTTALPRHMSVAYVRFRAADAGIVVPGGLSRYVALAHGSAAVRVYDMVGRFMGKCAVGTHPDAASLFKSLRLPPGAYVITGADLFSTLREKIVITR
jgi:hypothetical protein